MAEQFEMLFAAGPAPELHPPDPRGDFYAEVAAVWSLPVGQRVRVELSDHQFTELQGRLDLARAPDLPLNARNPLVLRIGTIEFANRQVSGWSLCDIDEQSAERR